ncbi:MAG: hypothetical protein P8M25_18775 [Paracoccaceae bacterium]|nr:hypothetical protein [Paracoccaceae bacterium]
MTQHGGPHAHRFITFLFEKSVSSGVQNSSGKNSKNNCVQGQWSNEVEYKQQHFDATKTSNHAGLD